MIDVSDGTISKRVPLFLPQKDCLQVRHQRRPGPRRFAVNHSFVFPRFRTSVLILSFLSPLHAASSDVIVMGFVGGFVRHNSSHHLEVQLAAHLSKDYPSGIAVRIFENHMGRQAHQEILRLLDADRNGTLSAGEKLKARIVLYGHSWGASEAVTMARILEKDGVPVLLTIQVDSVSKPGKNDSLIPANVAQAINFYQLNGILHGRQHILAADPIHTQILGNFQVEYHTKSVNCEGYPWYAQVFMKPHIEIESDPSVWNRIESLIRSKLPPAIVSTPAAE
jgi:hypothetical protein